MYILFISLYQRNYWGHSFVEYCIDTKNLFVIPKNIRDSLEIDSSVTLNITVSGYGIYISTVTAFVTKSDIESSYLKLLEKTRGTWVSEDWNKTREARSSTEIEASKRRKTSW